MAEAYCTISSRAVLLTISLAKCRSLWNWVLGFGFAQAPTDVYTYEEGWWMEPNSQLESC